MNQRTTELSQGRGVRENPSESVLAELASLVRAAGRVDVSEDGAGLLVGNFRAPGASANPPAWNAEFSE